MRVTKYKVSSGVHAINLDNSLNRLLSKNRFIDVTLACDGQKMRCHRLVLAAASPLFEELLMDNPSFHPTVIMPLGLKASTLKTLIEFMYTGEVNVTKTGLTELVESAEILQVAGIFDAATDIREYLTEVDDEQLDEESEGLEKYFQTFQFKINHVQERGTQTDPSSEVNQVNLTTAVITREKKSEQDVIDLIEIDDSIDVASENLDETSIDERSAITTNENPENACNNESKDSDTAVALIANDKETILQESNRNKMNNNKSTTMKDLIKSVDVQESVKQINLLQLSTTNGPGGGTKSFSKTFPWTYIHIPTVKTQIHSNVGKPSIQRPTVAKTNTPTPWTLYQPLPQLGPGQAYIASPIQVKSGGTIKPTPVTSFLKFNSSSMHISVKNLDRTYMQEKLKVVNMALEKESNNTSNPPAPPLLLPTELNEIHLKAEPGDGEITMGSTIVRQADFPMFYAMIKKEQEDLARQAKEKEVDELGSEVGIFAAVDSRAASSNTIDVASAKAPIAKETNAASPVNADEAEDIICQPSVSYIYDDDDDIKDDIECDDDEAGVCIDYDRLVAETYGIEAENEEKQKKVQSSTTKKQKKRQHKSKKIGEATPLFVVPKNSHRYKCASSSVPLSAITSTQPSKNYFYRQKANEEETNFRKDNPVFAEEHRSPKRENESHSPQTVILRSPRCNQPRHYSTDSLYSALMAVKHGESIYRASRQYAVPRKTLRNWMKRWDIKSKFPMPKQLKDAAKRKKLTLSPNM